MPRSYATEQMPDEPNAEDAEGHMPRYYAKDTMPDEPGSEPDGQGMNPDEIRLRATDDSGDAEGTDTEGHSGA